MRALIILAGATLALAGCRNNDQHDNTANVDENLSAESIVSNDVTAIDAVTGDAANMAADVNYQDTSDNSVANLSSNGPGVQPKSHPKPAPQTTEKASAPAPASNASTSNAE